MVEPTQWIIRFVHIMAGVMWIGGIFLWGMVLAPTITRRVAPAARGPVMKEVLPRLSRYLGISGIVTILSGLWVMGLITGFGNIVDVFQGRVIVPASYGYALGAAFVGATVMLAIAYGIVIPAANRMLAMMAKAPPPTPGTSPGPPPPEMMAIAKRLMMASMVNLTLGVIILGLMAWAVSARSGL